MNIAATREPTAPAPDPVEVLIKEARRRGRRHRYFAYATAALLVALLAWLLVTLSSGGGRSPAKSQPTVGAPAPKAPAIGAQLRQGSLGAYTNLLTGSMLSATSGYALAAGNGNRHEYLVMTHDAGRTWVVRGSLPYTYTGEGPVGAFQPMLVFAGREVGYAQPEVGSPIYMTTDGGLSWSQLTGTGRAPSFVITGGRLWVAGSSCKSYSQATGWEACPAMLTSYPIGSRVAASSTRLRHIPWTPFVGGNDGISSPSPGTIALDFTPPRAGFAAAVELTRDGGQTWRPMRWPCGSTAFTSLVGSANGPWVLSCFLGGGMMQGVNEVWRSYDRGASWQRLGYANEERRGNVGDVGYTLTSSGDGNVIYTAYGGAADGFLASSDGGMTWHGPDVHNNDAYVSVVPAGPEGAVVFTSGRAFWTASGNSWVVRTLPIAKAAR